MERHKHKDVKVIVEHLLTTIPETRESYDVLYVEYIRAIDPDAITRPFCITMTNSSFPSFQSVARASRAIKAACPWLRESDSNHEVRKDIEASYWLESGRRV